MAELSLAAAVLADRRAPDTASGLHVPAGALGRLVTRVCAVIFGVVARRIYRMLLAGVSAG
jgi:hypothetical protein